MGFAGPQRTFLAGAGFALVALAGLLAVIATRAGYVNPAARPPPSSSRARSDKGRNSDFNLLGDKESRSSFVANG